MSQYGIVFDHRRVQTAVIGDKNSDHPVILPMEADELDHWRRAHPVYTYWCGIQLGGCGGELSDKRYTDKVCHFAHHPSAPVCHRAANGESSADHLFIKRGVQRLLGKQKVRGQVRTRNLGTGPGDAVDVHLPGIRRRLRFQLSPLDYRTWRRADDDLSLDVDDLDWVFGVDTPVTRELTGRHGFCLRVRCETVGGERRVHIGAEPRDRTGPVDWTPLEDCELTPTGLVTPHLETIRLSGPGPKVPSFPLRGGFVFAPVDEADVPSSSPFATEDRHLLVADVKPVDSPVVRGLLSLPADMDAPSAEHVYRVQDPALMLVLEDGRGWAVEADRYTRLHAHEAQRTGLWTPRPGDPPEPELPPAGPPRAVRRPEPASRAEPAPVRPVTTVPVRVPVVSRPRTHADLVTHLRDALADSARLGSTTTWDELAGRVGFDSSRLSVSDRCDLLVEVDTPLSEYVPVRSALIRDGDGPLPYLGEILARLGVPYAKGSARLGQWAEAEVRRAFAAYGRPARAMDPRLDLAPARSSSVGHSELATALRAWRVPPPPPPRRTATAVPPRHATTTVKKRQDKRISDLIAELGGLRPRMSKSARKRANRVITGARVWLGELPVQRIPKRAKAAAKSRAQHVQDLEEAVNTARADIAAEGRPLPPSP